MSSYQPGGDLMTSSTTMRRSATNHKGATSQRAATDHKATQRQEATPDQRPPGSRGKTERDQAAPGISPLGIKLPGVAKGNLLWWGGLAALAAFEIVDWPVAALVATGAWIAERHMKQQQRQLARTEAG
jgi:hypothetical protein